MASARRSTTSGRCQSRSEMKSSRTATNRAKIKLVTFLVIYLIFENGDEQGEDQIDHEERDRAVGGGSGAAFKNREERQKNDDRAKVNDLPLKVAAIGFMRAHARGRSSSG